MAKTLSDMRREALEKGMTFDGYLSGADEPPLKTNIDISSLCEEDREKIDWCRNFVINLWELKRLNGK